MARQLFALFTTARRERLVDPPVKYFHAKLEATQKGGMPVAVACAKGCSHCCHAWVSATAPEVLYLAKRVRKARGPGERVPLSQCHRERSVKRITGSRRINDSDGKRRDVHHVIKCTHQGSLRTKRKDDDPWPPCQ